VLNTQKSKLIDFSMNVHGLIGSTIHAIIYYFFGRNVQVYKLMRFYSLERGAGGGVGGGLFTTVYFIT